MTTQADAILARLAAQASGVFTADEANEVGVSRRQLHRRVVAGSIVSLFPGVFADAAVPDSFERQMVAATKATGGKFAASHRSAARVHELDGFMFVQAKEVSVLSDNWSRLKGFRVHRAKDLTATTVGPITVVDIPGTIVDLASVMHRDLAMKAFDDAWRRGVPLDDIAEAAEAARRPGQKGPLIVLDFVEQARRAGTPPASWFERVVSMLIDTADLPPFARQHVVNDAAGVFIGRVDLAFPSVRLAIEAHSRRFHFGIGRETADEIRDLRLAAVGWETMYLGWHSTKGRPEDTHALVVQAVRSRERALS
jgi:nucleotide-binding universal stress UspA family protein